MFIRRNRKGDYAIRAILDLASHYGEEGPVSISGISRRQNVPLKYLEQIMLVLKGTGFVDSRRGAGGGFFLLKPPASITIGEVTRIFQPSSGDPADALARSASGDTGVRAIEEIWERAERSVSDVLDHVTFDDVIRRSAFLRERQGGYVYQI